jgi:choline dehydrogenase
MAAEFDTIIIGAGSAGSALAGRLGEDASNRILVLEAGGLDNHWMIRLPIGVAKVWNEPRFNWSYESEPEPFVDNRRIYHPRGKVVGGSSSINMMAYVRGNHRDFDRWRQKGLDGWSYADVLPYFKRAETWENGGSLYRGDSGPLRTQKGRSQDAIYAALVEAAPGLGYNLTDDFNAASQDGITRGQYTASHGRRYSAARAYLHPAIKRGNVSLETRAHVTALLFEDKRVVGVEYMQYGNRREARAREVILSGGSFNSPQLLLLSGIGPAQHLQDMGIAVQHDLPGVGSNLHDHFNTYCAWRISRSLSLNVLHHSVPHQLMAGLKYVLYRGGPMSGNGLYVGALVRSDPSLERPDLQMNISAWSTIDRTRDGIISHPFPAFAISPVHLRPEGRGTLRLKSPDPLAPPEIRFNFLRSDYDMRAVITGMRIARRIASQPALRNLVVEEVLPGASVSTDEQMADDVRQRGVSNLHPVGSCSMGHGPGAVVDPRLRVHGIGGLRVVDASIMPSIIAGNTNAPTIMIAEKASDMILEDAKALSQRQAA